MHKTVVLIILVVLSGLSLASSEKAIDSIVIPRKTEIYITLQRSISAQTAQQGDRFHGTIDVPVTVEDEIVLPPGTYVMGYVDYAKPSGGMKGKARLRLMFDTVILPDGTTRQIKAYVQTADEHKMDPDDEEGTIEGKVGKGSETAGAAAEGALAGGIGSAIGSRSLSGAAIGAAAGAATGAILGLFKKGSQLVLAKGTSLTIQLDQDIQFVRHEKQDDRQGSQQAR